MFQQARLLGFLCLKAFGCSAASFVLLLPLHLSWDWFRGPINLMSEQKDLRELCSELKPALITVGFVTCSECYLIMNLPEGLLGGGPSAALLGLLMPGPG